MFFVGRLLGIGICCFKGVYEFGFYSDVIVCSLVFVGLYCYKVDIVEVVC